MLFISSYNLLRNVSLTELKTLRVAIRRRNISTSAPPGPLVRDIEDPKEILPCVHYRGIKKYLLILCYV